ncbi:dynein light chain [Grosmannia clavigera kw1407]|uniref:Dynein light chain n=1 Tax=Grosmannia clavigera (strain kw1407 / UAMH 11150) TaxID=655863 RepID=F0XDW0_GROCL|nr:dynein light chain [Grosmannia clavigera kw1407]EFX04569.1 dynein light chain [Grosmannia clavigera kw1407]
MASAPTNSPIKPTRLKQIAEDACQSALGSAEFYEHDKTEQWNTTIINSILKALIAESPSGVAGAPTYKFAVNSTIVQHLIPTSQLNKSRGAGTGSVEDASADGEQKKVTPDATSTDGKPHVGRRGMHSAQAAYWNEKTDGMWTYKYDGGESKGLDVVVMVLWVAFDR